MAHALLCAIIEESIGFNSTLGLTSGIRAKLRIDTIWGVGVRLGAAWGAICVAVGKGTMVAIRARTSGWPLEDWLDPFIPSRSFWNEVIAFLAWSCLQKSGKRIVKYQVNMLDQIIECHYIH